MILLKIIVLISCSIAVVFIINDYIIPFFRIWRVIVKVIFLLWKAARKQKDPEKKKSIEKALKEIIKIAKK